MNPGPILRDTVKNIVAASDGGDEKLRKLYAAVMSVTNVDYSPSPSPPGLAVQTHNATDAWTRKRGTAAQLTGLFVAMARAAGMKAYVAAVGNREIESFAEQYPDMAQLDDRIAIVVVDGKERFFDPGSRFCAYGQLAWNHTAMKGLRETEKGTAFIETPVGSYKDSTTVRTAVLTLDADGKATGTVQVAYTGAPALYWRETALADEESGFERKLADDLQRRLPAMTVSVSSVSGVAEFDKPLTVSFSVSGRVASVAAGRLLVQSDLLEANERSHFASKERAMPVVFAYPSATHDSVMLHLPSGFSAEADPTTVSVPFERYAAYSLEQDVAEGTLALKRDLIIGEVFFAPKDYVGLQTFFKTVRDLDSKPIALQGVPQSAN